MPECNEVKISRILNPTSIDLAEFVINPFMGCEYACLYCYVRSNRVISKRALPWGEYVDIRINAPELLIKEIALKKPKCVLLGSTTECFQPVEKKYHVTSRILEVLNGHGVPYVILTRSPHIAGYLTLLKKGYCKKIYFSINNYPFKFKQRLEPKSPAFAARDEAVRALLEEGLPVVPYFSPVLPWISDLSNIFTSFTHAEAVEFECLNFRLKNIFDIIDAVAGVAPTLKEKYIRMLGDEEFYGRVWQEMEKYISQEAQKAKKRYTIYVHSFGDYFKNSYT